ncbi:MAG: DUF4347 domain-containing protein, partial [Granulosicoccus sp.]|nr:DUF4347 domain-containing protein [Granulosicoccus sp.]
MKKSLSLLGYSATLLFNFSVMLTASANADSTINPIGSSAFEEAAGPAVEPYADVVFVDKYLPELTELLNRYAGADVILIDHKSDGLQQIAQALAHRTNINSIHILSHGKPGEINLGRAPIDISSLGRHASGDFALIRSALAEDADILLYGCNVAFGDSGTQFVRQLAAVTDADIAASDDLTGALKHGANWELEISHGSIETTAMNLFAFNGVLGDTDGDTIDDFEDVDDDNDGILDSDERPSVAFAQTFPTSGGNTEFVSGWTVGGTYPSTGPWVSAGRVHLGSNGLTFMRDTDSITTFSRPFSGLTGPQISIYSVRWNNAANGDDTTDTHATMTVSYDGTDYLIIDLSPSQTPSVTALNGASVNTSVLETLIQAIDGASVFSDPKDLMLTLPDTAPSAGDLRFTFTAGPNLSEVRDIAFTGIDILNSRDTDGDAIFDHLDLDSDNDGISDLKESRFGALDADNNGVVDGIATGDSNSDGHLDSLVGKNLTDTDFDTFFDTVDLDSDGDGIADTLEANATVNGNLGAAYDAVTDLVSNHSFSSGDTGWTLIEGSGDATLPSASSGRMYFNSSDLPAGDAVEQSITTSAGLYYLITFELEETGTGSSSHTMLIELLDASSNVLASSSRTVENGGVVQDSLHFQAVGTATTVRFTNTFTENSVDSDLYLDYASVRAVGNDADSDGVSGLFDNDSVFGGSDLLDPLDTDSASIPDYIDLDSDNDGLGDASESGLTSGSDSNGDGIGDALGVSYADTDGTVDPATINAYRDNGLSTAILAEVLEDSSSPGGANNSNASLVTATELGSINGVTNVDLANESLYQSLIQDTTTFSNPPTAAEVQNIIDAVNASEIAIAEVLEDSDARGGTNNANATAVTASQLSEIIGISNVFAAHEVAYQTVIFATATFSDPPTVSEIQSIIDTVNSSEFAIAEVLEDSSSAGGGGNGNATAVTAAQLGAIAGIANVDPANELAYQSLISATTSFANPPTVAQIQTVIDLVNASELAIAEVLEDSDSRGGANNSNAVPVTSTQLAAIIGVTNVDSANELAYQSKIALTAGFSDPPLASEIQSLIDTVNASEYALIEVLEDSDSVGGENNGNSVLVTATQLAAIDGIVNVVSANEDSYQAVILSTTTFSDPPTVAEVQSIVDLVNLSETAIAEVLEDSSSIGGANNSNAVAVTASQLNNIVGITAVDLDNETPYQAMIAGTSTFANPPSLIEIQLIIDTVNASEEG